MQDFFEFVVNCPYWQDYLDEDEYQNRESLDEFAKGVYEEHIEGSEADLCDFNLPEAQEELVNRLKIEKKSGFEEVIP